MACSSPDSLAFGWPGRRKHFVARCTRHSDVFLADRAFVVPTPSYCPVFCSSLVSSPGPSPGSRSTNGRQHRVFFFSLLPGHPGKAAIGHQPQGKRHKSLAPFSPSLVFSSAPEPDLSVCASDTHLCSSQARCSRVSGGTGLCTYNAALGVPSTSWRNTNPETRGPGVRRPRTSWHQPSGYSPRLEHSCF